MTLYELAFFLGLNYMK